MGKHDLGNKDIHKDAAALAVLLNGKVGAGGGGGNFPLFIPAIADDLAVVFYPMTGIRMANGASTTVGGGMFRIPAGWSGTLTVSAIIEAGTSTSGNIYTRIRYHRAAVGDLIISTSPSYAAQAIAADSNGKYLSVNSQVIGSAVASDLVNLAFVRNGGNAADTYEADIYCYGFLIDWG